MNTEMKQLMANLRNIKKPERADSLSVAHVPRVDNVDSPMEMRINQDNSLLDAQRVKVVSSSIRIDVVSSILGLVSKDHELSLLPVGIQNRVFSLPTE